MLRTVFLVCLSLFQPFAGAVAEEQRIVSLAPSLTEAVYALGAGERLVGVSRFCDFPEEAGKLPKVGGFLDPNYEAIVALKPTAVLLLKEQQQAADRLKALEIDCLLFSNRSIEEILQSITRLGDALQVEAQAEKLRRELSERVRKVEMRTAKMERPSVLVTVDGHSSTSGLRSAQVAGTDTIFDELVRRAGGKNAFTSGKRYSSFSAEGIFALSPDIIIDLVPDAGRKGLSEAAVRDAWQQFPLLSRSVKRIEIVSEEYAVNPGPRIVETLELFARIIHPDA